MAIEPLFLASKDELKSRLRLSGAAQADALAQVDHAIEDVRMHIYDEDRGLGAARVTEILTVSYVENATTSAAMVRTMARSLECAWVRLLLLRRMPMIFMDASAVTQEVWNEEPVTRFGPSGVRQEIERLEQEIQDLLANLGGDEDDAGIGVVVFEPEETPDRPGWSIAPEYLVED